ncbi:hypothetical protein DESC_500125 [Desulfosarcina cetonica]|uniref:PAS domain-containing sensor histidine kinase n=1 Tax=Desulfosarcina cetonica TaxID=90730 RepID=UPI0006CFF1D8|nr:PAS domain S-box protein [Desulfosarcina cetonica]VTR66742.1 hypothetical protein DESC_500125 [Desulfosarcina cetonica]
MPNLHCFRRSPADRRLLRHARALQRSRDHWCRKAKTLCDAMARYETIFKNSGTATILIEEDFTISAINDGFARLMGMLPEEIEGRIQWTTFIHPDDLPRMKQYHISRRIDPDAAPRKYEFCIRSRDKGYREVAISIDMVPGTTQSIASMVDVTDTRRLEREVIAVGERERRRIGRDLHDDLGSHLSGVEMLSKVLEQKIAACSPAASREMATIRMLISEATEKIRRLAQGLYPVHIVEHGLEAAMEALVDEVAEVFDIVLEIAFDPAVEALDHTAATHLYYIVREAVFNAARHGRPSRLGVTIQRSGDRFRAIVQDNGHWREKSPTERDFGGMGLHTMAYRARAMGATLTIDTDTDGTRVTLSGSLNEAAGGPTDQGNLR